MGAIRHVVHLIIFFAVVVAVLGRDIPAADISHEESDLDSPPVFGERKSLYNQMSSGIGNRATDNRQKKCGAVLRCSNDDHDSMGSVNNILFQPIGPIHWNDRCIWVVAGPAATKYTLKVTELDYIGAKNNYRAPRAGILVSGASHENDFLTTLNIINTNKSVTIHANVIFITVWTRAERLEDVGKGILINYLVESEADGQIAPASSDSIHKFICPGESVHHPPVLATARKITGEATTFDFRRELSTYVFLPAHNRVYLDQHGKYQNKMSIFYKKDKEPDETGCEQQRIEIYTFKLQTGEAPIWKHYDSICDGIRSQDFITHDITMMLVRSKRNAEDAERSFTLSYSE